MPVVRVRRIPILYWAGALTLAVLTGGTVARLIDEAAARAQHWGEVVTVPVTAHEVAAGAVLEADDVVLRQMPAALLPSAPPAEDPVGRATIVALAAGELVLESRLAGAGKHGPAALLPPGHRGIAIPRGEAVLPLAVGDAVDVLATFATDGTSTGAPTFAVASSALVIGIDDDQVTVAVAAEDAPRVAFALAQGAVTLALTADP